jgi:hypothetical protein
MLKAAPSTQQAVYFSGLEAPVLLKNAEALFPVLKQALPSWRFSVTDGATSSAPSMTITGKGDGTFLCQSGDPAIRARRWDDVNAVCEMIVALAWAQIQSNPSWLCLHCAAVAFNGRLVLFPNRRRSGKSTLTAVLARRGYTVFSDDFLPIRIGDDGVMLGVANGINPRMRLPIAEGFSADFRTWVQRATEVSNGQYAYLGINTLAPRGAVLPIGAIVALDRHDSACEAGFHPIEPMDVLDDLITQNFGRMAHSGRILAASHGVAQTALRHRLTYGSAEDAATFLESQFQNWDAPVAQVFGTLMPIEFTADLQVMETEPALFDPSAKYQKATGIHEICIADQVYVSDGHGVGIQKLNPGSSLIWGILEDHTTLAEITDLLCAAFPDHPRTEIASDCAKTLQQFLKNHLTVSTIPVEER